MNCPTEEELSFFADGELESARAAAIDDHRSVCSECKRLLTALENETKALRKALRTPTKAAASALPRPAAAGAAVLGLPAAGWVFARGWSLSLEAVPSWLNPLAPEGGLNLFFNFLVFLGQLGGSLMTQIDSWSFAMAGASLLLLTLAPLGPLYRLRAKAAPLALMTVAFALISQPASAWDFRSGSSVTVAQGEVLDETLIATGEVVRIDGDVRGDVLAFARQVTITGTVTGSVLTAAQSVDVDGEIGGTLAGFGQFVRVGAAVGGNLYSCGQNVSLLEGGSVGRDALMAGELLTASGNFERDVTAAGRKLTIGGRIGRNLLMEGDELEILASGEVGGAIAATLPSQERLQVASGAVVSGPTEVSQPAAAKKKQSKYRSSGFYVWGLIKLAGTFVLGSLLIWLVPGVFGYRIGSVGAGFRRAGVGFLVLVATPVALVLAAISLIGLPIALVGTILFVLGLYLSKIVVADWLGRLLLRSDRSRENSGFPDKLPTRRFFPALLVGLAVLVVAGALPWIGGWVKFAVLLLGLGILFARAQWAVRRST